MSAPAYAELHCLSNFSFLRGASFPEELVLEALRLRYTALAITDECSLAGVVRAHSALQQARRDSVPGADVFRLIIGSEFVSEDGLHIVLLARNRTGYGQIARLISEARHDSPKGSYRFVRDMLAATAFSDCLALWVPGTACHPDHVTSDIAKSSLRWLSPLFPDRLWLTGQHHLSGHDQQKLAALQKLGAELDLPVCASGAVLMHRRQRRFVRDTVAAIRLGCTVDNLGFCVPGNAEQYLRPRQCLTRLYPPALLAETCNIARQCNFSLAELRYEYPHELVPSGHTPQSWLRKLTETGMHSRWPDGVPAKVTVLVERELMLIAELGYEHFFLTVKDIVDFANSHNILCQGRGSAANSAVCYCLGITAVDPSRMSLLFERFLSKERDEPPDIDVDFEHERREEVIQYIYNKYGRHRAALAATVICYRRRSAIRDVGKALGLQRDVIEHLVSELRFDDNGRSVMDEVPDIPQRTLQMLIFLVCQIMGFPRHLSQHVGGFVISQGPLAELVPVENAAMPGRTVIQWEKDDLEALGLLKVDVLALGMLTAIRKALALISKRLPSPMTLAEVPAEDPAVYEMITQADTIGVFQIESRAQMSMLPRLKPRNYYDLVIQIAIVRPGPIQGDMVHPYLMRRKGVEPVTYPGPAVASVLERTLGVPIFQEQVMQIAIVAAGFSGGEADQLRRAMAAWKRKGGLEPFRDKLIAGMRERGYEDSFAQQIYSQIKGFGDYGFPESHSASFALLAYVSSWLKCHHPAAFTCALLNSQPMGFYAPAQLVQDARRHGVQVLPVDVNRSEIDCTLVYQRGRRDSPVLQLGLRMVSGLSTAAMERLVTGRRQGVFVSIADVVRRVGLNSKDRDSLAAADAFRALAGDRHRAFWQAAGVEEVPPLFVGDSAAYGVEEKQLSIMLPPATEMQNIMADYNSTGLSLRRHPLALMRDRLDAVGITAAAALADLPDRQSVRIAGLVTCRQRPQTAAGVTFLTLEDETGFANVVVWRQLAESQRRIVQEAGLIVVFGQLQQSDGVTHVIARRLMDISHSLQGMTLRSRDFC